jgi:hypothetical protein
LDGKLKIKEINDMAFSKPSRRAFALLTGALLLAPSLAGAQSAPADLVIGVYRGQVTAGSGAGTAVVVTVVKVAPDRVRLLSNRPAVAEAEVKLVASGGQVVQAEGTAQVKVDVSARPATLEYRPGGDVVFSGTKL